MLEKQVNINCMLKDFNKKTLGKRSAVVSRKESTTSEITANKKR